MSEYNSTGNGQKKPKIAIACNEICRPSSHREFAIRIGYEANEFEFCFKLRELRLSGYFDECDVLLFDIRTELDFDLSELSDLVGYCQQCRKTLILISELNQIDMLSDLVLASCVHLVIGDDTIELISILSFAKRTMVMGTLFDPSRERSSPELSKISAELLEFARALSRIAEAEDNSEMGADYLADKPRSYAPPSGIVTQPFTSVAASAAEASLDPQTIRSLIRVRRLRDRFFHEELFADPAWDILLDLMASRLEGTKVSVSSLCIAAAVPATTALRWIKSMTDDGYLERRADPTDARRVYIHLSDATAQKMAQYLHARAEVSAI